MVITKDIGAKLIEKAEKILGRKVYLYDISGNLLNDLVTNIDFQALISIQKQKEVVERRGGHFFSWQPLTYEEEVVGSISVSDEVKEKSKEMTSLARGLIETLMYEEFLVKNIYITNDLRSEFIKEILTGTSIKTTEEAIDQGDILGVNLRSDQGIMIIHIDNLYDDYINLNGNFSFEEKQTKFQEYLKKIEEQIRSGFGDKLQNTVVYVGDGKFIILKDIRKEELNTINSVKPLKGKGSCIYRQLQGHFPNKMSLGIGQFYPGLSGLRKSYEDASIALALGRKVLGPGKVYHVLDVAMFLGLWGSLSNTRKNELVYQVLKDLFADKDLLKTTVVFLDCGMNLTEASKKLHLHRNTLIYRLDKVKQIIGLNPRNFKDAVQIKLGLMINSNAEQPSMVG